MERIISGMFNTVSRKKIAVLGFAFKKDTGDTRETPAIDVCNGLIKDGANLCIYDPKVEEDQVYNDLSMDKFMWDYPDSPTKRDVRVRDSTVVYREPYACMDGAHGVAVLTEWDEFKQYDWKKIYDNMVKPAFVFDGRNILDHQYLRDLGYIVYAIGKPLDPFMKST